MDKIKYIKTKLSDGTYKEYIISVDSENVVFKDGHNLNEKIQELYNRKPIKKVSELENDLSFQTNKDVENLLNERELATKEELNKKIDIYQGIENINKILRVNSDGQLELINFNEESFKTYVMNIVSSNGTVFQKGLVDTYLSPILFFGQEDVTDNFLDHNFIWTRQSEDSYGDLYWNDRHRTGTKKLHITTEDVYRGACFTCSFYENDIELAKASF